MAAADCRPARCLQRRQHRALFGGVRGTAAGECLFMANDSVTGAAEISISGVASHHGSGGDNILTGRGVAVRGKAIVVLQA